jgi:hypothetical protein
MDPITAAALAGVLLTVAVLAAGISSMATDGEVAHRSSGEWMVARVAIQGLTLILLLAASLMQHL